MSNLLVTEVVVALAAVVGLVTFIWLVAAPSIAARERVWERIVTGLLSIYVLAVLVAIGLAAGIGIIWLWPQLP